MTTLTAISDPHSFWEEARYQRVCAVCDRVNGRPDARGSTWHAHHVIPKDILRRLGLPEYDTRGALRVCTDCHMNFEWAGPGKVPLTPRHMTDQNICYIWEVMGVAVVMLERKYGEFDHEPRWVKHRMGECELCQLRSA